jgi:hypothetical protein
VFSHLQIFTESDGEVWHISGEVYHWNSGVSVTVLIWDDALRIFIGKVSNLSSGEEGMYTVPMNMISLLKDSTLLRVVAIDSNGFSYKSTSDCIPASLHNRLESNHFLQVDI